VLLVKNVSLEPWRGGGGGAFGFNNISVFFYYYEKKSLMRHILDYCSWGKFFVLINFKTVPDKEESSIGQVAHARNVTLVKGVTINIGIE